MAGQTHPHALFGCIEIEQNGAGPVPRQGLWEAVDDAASGAPDGG